MHIWYMNHYAGSKSFPKEGRSYFLARGLLKAGATCSVIAASYHHLQKGVHHEQSLGIEKENVEGIPFLWLKTPKYVGNGFSRIKNMLAYSYACWKTNFVSSGFLEKPNVIIVTSVHPFHIFSGYRWAKYFDAKLVFEVRDIWPLSLNLLLGLKKWHPLYLLLAFMEKFGYRNADLVVSVLPNALKHMEPKGVEPERFLYLPNGFISDFPWKKTNKYKKELAVIRSKYSRVIMHTGSMGKPNGLEMLIDAANELAERKDIAFVFIGSGSLKDELVLKSKSPNIFHFDPIDKDEVMSALSYSDICYCGSQDLSELYKFGISPNKVFDYMFAKKMILLGIDSPNNPVEVANAGYCFSPSQHQQLHHIISDIADEAEPVLRSKGLSGYDYLINNHDFDVLAQKLLTRLS
ncbi:glycosyltransferase family 4 protein [Vibrio sp. HN007]|uniref:glycosyltransferase family 4 protein n=1 Tax=Vibrio iocasae TaxID=3098914 RepID=UPI0035D4B2FD